jgi:hypothetical protein
MKTNKNNLISSSDRTESITTDELERRFDAGENVLKFFDVTQARRRGGARAGAGRKALGKQRKMITLSPSSIRAIKAHYKGMGVKNFSDAIEAYGQTLHRKLARARG